MIQTLRHLDCQGRLAVIHNGIIENHTVLRRELVAAGHTFKSQTDTEVVCHMLEDELRGDDSEAVERSHGATVRSHEARPPAETGCERLIQALMRVFGSFSAAIRWLTGRMPI